ncbi:MAG: Amidohydrolase [Candidatus Binatota bacterium]|nr:Amidohydrolase [Candidatus Binatota bacterium]
MTAVDVHHHYVPKQLIEETKRHGKVLGVDKLMLGTDYPYTLGDWLGGENIHALKCSVAEKDAILEGNARVLKL